MATAEPHCKRCSIKMVFIGIGGGAEPACPIDCTPVPAGDKCPGCLSLKIERFDTLGWLYGQYGVGTDDTNWHCLDCGKVFAEDAIDRR